MPKVRPIDANALKNDMQEYFDNIPVYMPGVFHVIERASTIEPEVRHGQWKKKNGEIYCTNCKKSKWSESFELMLRRFNFCPNCGAKMFQSGGFITKERLAKIMNDGTRGDYCFFDTMEGGANGFI